MPLYLVEADATWMPLAPVGGWFGPLESEIAVTWIAEELDADENPIIVPEIEFPSCRHFRNPCWLFTGTRPPRAMPRGFGHLLTPDGTPGGDEPPGLIDTELQCWADDPESASNLAADYDDNDGAAARCVWLFETDALATNTDADPRAWVDSDFKLRMVARYFDSVGTRWVLVNGPEGYSGATTLPAPPLFALALAREGIGPTPPKRRSIVIMDVPGNVCGPNWHSLPFTIPESQYGTPERVALPEAGLIVSRWTYLVVRFNIAGLLSYQIQFDNYLTTAICNWSGDPGFPSYHWRFLATGSPVVDPILPLRPNQEFRVEQEQNGKLNTIRWYVDDELQATFQGLRWTPCTVTYEFTKFFNFSTNTPVVIADETP